jgi:hypothetical protein
MSVDATIFAVVIGVITVLVIAAFVLAVIYLISSHRMEIKTVMDRHDGSLSALKAESDAREKNAEDRVSKAEELKRKAEEKLEKRLLKSKVEADARVEKTEGRLEAQQVAQDLRSKEVEKLKLEWFSRGIEAGAAKLQCFEFHARVQTGLWPRNNQELYLVVTVYNGEVKDVKTNASSIEVFEIPEALRKAIQALLASGRVVVGVPTIPKIARRA